MCFNNVHPWRGCTAVLASLCRLFNLEPEASLSCLPKNYHTVKNNIALVLSTCRVSTYIYRRKTVHMILFNSGILNVMYDSFSVYVHINVYAVGTWLRPLGLSIIAWSTTWPTWHFSGAMLNFAADFSFRALTRSAIRTVAVSFILKSHTTSLRWNVKWLTVRWKFATNKNSIYLLSVSLRQLWVAICNCF